MESIAFMTDRASYLLTNPYRALGEVRLGLVQVFIAQEIEGNLFIADGCALVPFQLVFLFPLIPKGSSFRVTRYLPLPLALIGNVDIPAVLTLAIFYAEGL